MNEGRRAGDGHRWLVFTRRAGEVVRIGDVVIVVREASGRQTKLAIAAPPQTRVDRGEIPRANADGLLARVFGGRLPPSCFRG